MIDIFQGRWFFLSNFFPCEIEHKGIKYPSVEHYYVAMKVTEIQLLNGQYYTAGDFRELIAKIKLPADVKKIGQKIKVRRDWEEKKLEFMNWGVREKFKNEKLSELLLLTADLEIVENNYWHDNFWGSCTCSRCGRKGENNLGKILMNVRQELKQQRGKSSIEDIIKNKKN
jgi:ribA/ribD-fused uncharacterized protein